MLVIAKALRLFAASLTAAFVLGVQPGAAHGPNGEMGGEVPTVAGPFALTDHSGNPASNEDFLGQYMIVIFGYTVCPDFCPLELQNAAAVLDALGPAGGKAQPLFITIDPERDTPETLAEYVRHFHPKIIGLTGSMDAIHVAADGFGMWFEKTAVLTTPDGLIYFVSHLALNYVVGPDGAIIMAFPSGIGPEEISAAILEHMKTGGAEAGAI